MHLFVRLLNRTMLVCTLIALCAKLAFADFVLLDPATYKNEFVEGWPGA